MKGLVMLVLIFIDLAFDYRSFITYVITHNIIVSIYLKYIYICWTYLFEQHGLFVHFDKI